MTGLAPTGNPMGGRQAPVTFLDKLTRFASARLGIAASDLLTHLENWGPGAVTAHNMSYQIFSGGGGGATAADHPGGVIRVACGAAAGAFYTLAAREMFLPRTDTGRGLFLMRFRLANAVIGDTRLWAGITDSGLSNTILLGARGTIDAANFIMQYDGSAGGSHVDLGPADQAFHVIGVAFRDGRLQPIFDGRSVGAPVSQASPIITACRTYIDAETGAGGVAQALEMDWFFQATTGGEAVA